MERSVVYGVQTIQTTSFETTHLRPLIWDHVHWDLLVCDSSFVWDHIHLRLVELRPVHLRRHSCETRFLLWLFRPAQRDIFSFLVFHFSVKNWNCCCASIWKKPAGTQNIQFFDLVSQNDISKCNAPIQTRGMKSFLSSAVFSSASAFTTQRESTWTRKGATLQNFKWRVALQNFRTPAKKCKLDHKNVIW